MLMKILALMKEEEEDATEKLAPAGCRKTAMIFQDGMLGIHLLYVGNKEIIRVEVVSHAGGLSLNTSYGSSLESSLEGGCLRSPERVPSFTMH